LFVNHGTGVRNAIPSMPGHFQLSIDNLEVEAARAVDSGLAGVILFGLPAKKDALGSEAYAPSGIVQRAVKALKAKHPELVVMTDLCFCEYTTHGHCGVLKSGSSGDVDNDATLDLIRKTAVVQARAGADIVAPSGMMDGAVAAIREALDEAGFSETGILAYSAKFASVFYGPFREAAGSAPRAGNRKGYQMNPANAREALREIRADAAQGADMVMVKPALAYLDIIARIRPQIDLPIVAYNVSGEFAMVRAAEDRGWLDGAADLRAPLEILTAIKRAGADLIITYHALEAAAALREKPDGA
jgi:porphobilinogen synthase